MPQYWAKWFKIGKIDQVMQDSEKTVTKMKQSLL